MDINIEEDQAGEAELIGSSNHLCWVYDNDDDQMAIMKPFVLSHLMERHKCLLVVPKEIAASLYDALRKDDFNVERYIDSGQLSAVDPADLFFAGGPFDVDVILHRMQSAWTEAVNEGWGRLAVVSDPSTVLEGADDRDWLALEFRTDFECLTQPCSMLCLYDAREASGAFITQIIKVHPVVGLGKGVARNPFYGPQANEAI